MITTTAVKGLLALTAAISMLVAAGVLVSSSPAVGAVGNFTVAPTTLNFPDTYAGATSSIPVTVTNVSGVSQTPGFSGGAPLDSANFGGSQNCAGKTFAAGETCTFTYVFHPDSSGAKSSSTVIGIDAQSFSITMSGNGLFPFTVAPTTLNFPDTYVGATSSIPVTVTNISGVSQTPGFSGGAPLDSANFGGSQNCAGKTFAAGETCTFTYVFDPDSSGAKSSSTVIGIDEQSFPITLSGNALFPFTVAPTTLNFPDTYVGATSSLAVTVTNISGITQTPNYAGGAPFDVVNFGGFQNCAGVPLTAGATCTFTYQFHPASSGAKSSSTSIEVDDQVFNITMSGTGLGFIVVPTTLNFPDTYVGEASSMFVTVINVSGVVQTPNFSTGAPLDAANFGSSQTCAGKTLAPGDTCIFNYQFHPTSPGVKTSSATISIDDETIQMTMSGTGLFPFTVAPTALNFPDTYVGATSSLGVTITNISDVPQIPSFAAGVPLDSANFGVSQNCVGTTLPAGGTCTFTYQFHPSAPGAKSTSASIGVAGENFAITMTGTGLFPFTVVPTVLNFPDTDVGASSSLAVTITNISGVSQSPSFSGGAPLDSANFSGSLGCAGKTLAAGGTCTLSYVFHPATTGPKSSIAVVGIDARAFIILMYGSGLVPFTELPTFPPAATPALTATATQTQPATATAALTATATPTRTVTSVPATSTATPPPVSATTTTGSPTAAVTAAASVAPGAPRTGSAPPGGSGNDSLGYILLAMASIVAATGVAALTVRARRP